MLQGLPQDLKSLSNIEIDNFSKNLLVYVRSLSSEQQIPQSWQQILGCFGMYFNKLLTSMPDIKVKID